VVARADNIEAKLAQAKRDIEAMLAQAKRDAARLKHSITVRGEGGTALAVVWPGGQIDIQSDGALLITTTPAGKVTA
jgi:hypothetical protein